MSLVSMSDQFQGLPMESLIGGPLTAATNAQVMLAQSTADFINRVGFDVDTTGPEPVRGAMRYVTFEFERPKQIETKTGTGANEVTTTKTVPEKVKLTVPLLSIVPVPNLQIDNVDVTFDMEVSSSEESKSSKDLEVGWDVTVGAKFGPVSISAKVTGKLATHQENTRKSDNSAKYHVAVNATNHGMPEGLQRVWDIMAESVAPVTKVDDTRELTA